METDPHARRGGRWRSPPTRSARRRAYRRCARQHDDRAIARLRAARSRPRSEAGLPGHGRAGHRLRAVTSRCAALPARFVVGEETVLLRAHRGQARSARPAAAVPGRARACGTSRRSSTTSRRWPRCPGSWPTARAPSAKLGAADDPARRSSSSPAPSRSRASSRCPLGTPLRGLIEAVGGGATGTLKAVLVGGPSGGFLPADAAATRPIGGGAGRGGRHRGLGHARRRGRVDLPRRPGHAADALPVRRVVRQDHPLPHRHAPPGRARRSGAARGRSPADRRRSCCPTSPPTSADGGAVRPRAARRPTRCLSGMRYFAAEFEDHIVAPARARPAICQPVRVRTVARSHDELTKLTATQDAPDAA